MSALEVTAALPELRARIAGWRDRHEVVAFVPTMGNLHRGHLHLVETAARQADRVVVSIFVNPAQFAEGEDFEGYPRTLDQDQIALSDVACDLLYIPDSNTMYPNGLKGITRVKASPKLSNTLCGKDRAGHFDGVADVLVRLFNQVMPQIACFGEKDFQQLRIIQQLVDDLSYPIKIHPVATQRDKDMLALSSRNAYLSKTQRAQAPELYATLRWLADTLASGANTSNVVDIQQISRLEAQAEERLVAAGFVPEYIQVLDAVTLQPSTGEPNELRVFAAARLGRARLIDNLPVTKK